MASPAVDWRALAGFTEAPAEDRAECIDSHRRCVETLKASIREVLRTTLHAKTLESASEPTEVALALRLITRTLQGYTCRFGNHVFGKKTVCGVLLNLLKLLAEPAFEVVADDFVQTIAQLVVHLSRQDLSILHGFVGDCVAALERMRDRPLKLQAFTKLAARCKAVLSDGGSAALAGVPFELGGAARTSTFTARLVLLSTAVAQIMAPFLASLDVEALWCTLLNLAQGVGRSTEHLQGGDPGDALRVAGACLRGLRDLASRSAEGPIQRTSLRLQLEALETLPGLAEAVLRHHVGDASASLVEFTCRALADYDDGLVFPRLLDVLQPFWPSATGSACTLKVFLVAATRFAGIPALTDSLVHGLVAGPTSHGEASWVMRLSPEEHRMVASALYHVDGYVAACAHAVQLCRDLCPDASGNGEQRCFVVALLSLAVRSVPAEQLASALQGGDAQEKAPAQLLRAAALALVEAGGALLRQGAAAPAGAGAGVELGGGRECALEFLLATALVHDALLQKLEQDGRELLLSLVQGVAVARPPALQWRLFLLAMAAFVVRPATALDLKHRFLHDLAARAPAGAVASARHVDVAAWVAIGRALLARLRRGGDEGAAPPGGGAEGDLRAVHQITQDLLRVLASPAPLHPSALAAMAYLFPLLVTFAASLPALLDQGDASQCPDLAAAFSSIRSHLCPAVFLALGMPSVSPKNPMHTAASLAAGGAGGLPPSPCERRGCAPMPLLCPFCDGAAAACHNEVHDNVACSSCGLEALTLDWDPYGISEAARDGGLSQLCSAWCQVRRPHTQDSGATVQGTAGHASSARWLRNAEELAEVLAKLTRAVLQQSPQGPLSLLEPSDSQDAAAARGAVPVQRGMSCSTLWLLSWGLFGLCASASNTQLRGKAELITELFHCLLSAGPQPSAGAANPLVAMVNCAPFVRGILGVPSSSLPSDARAVQRSCQAWQAKVLGIGGASGSQSRAVASWDVAAAADGNVSRMLVVETPQHALQMPAADLSMLSDGTVATSVVPSMSAALVAGATESRSPRLASSCVQHLLALCMLRPIPAEDLSCKARRGVLLKLVERYSRRNERVHGLCHVLLRGPFKEQVRALLPVILPSLVLHGRAETIQELCALLGESAPSMFTPQLPYVLAVIAEQPVQQVARAFMFISEKMYNKQMTMASLCDASLGKVLVRILWGSSAAAADLDESSAHGRAQGAVQRIVATLKVPGGDYSGAVLEQRKRGAADGAAGGPPRKRRAGELPGTQPDAQPTLEVVQTLEGNFLHIIDILEIVITKNRQSPKWAEYSPLLRDVQECEDVDYARLFAVISLLFTLVKDSLHRFAPKILEFLQCATHHSDYCAASIPCWEKYVRLVGTHRLKPLLPAIVGELLRLATRLRQPSPQGCQRLCAGVLTELVADTCRQHPDTVAFLPSLPAWPELESAAVALRANLGAQQSVSFDLRLAMAVQQLEGAGQQAMRRAALDHLRDLFRSRQEQLSKCAIHIETALLSRLIRALFKFLWESAAWPADQRKCGELLGQVGAIDPSRFTRFELVPTRGKTAQDYGNMDQMVAKVLTDFLVPNLTSKNSYAYAAQEILKCLQASGTSHRILSSLKEEMRETLKPYLHSSYQLLESGGEDKAAPDKVRGASRSMSALLNDISTFDGVVAHAIGIMQNKLRPLFEACLPAVPGNHALALFLMHYALHDLLSSGTGIAELSSLSDALAGLLDVPGYEAAQAVFSLVDDINHRREEIEWETSGVTRAPDVKARDRMLQRIDAMRKPITNRKVVAAAVRCGAHARALQFFEEAVVDECHGRGVNPFDEPRLTNEEDCLLLQSIYRELDEPDGVLGALRIGPATARTRCLQLEQAGRWHDAQSCYEEQLASSRHSPQSGGWGKLQLLSGLVRCSQNMRRFESSLRLVDGAGEDAEAAAVLQPYAVEAAWQLSSWDRLEQALGTASPASTSAVTEEDFQVSLGRALLAVHRRDAASLRAVTADATLQVTRTLASAARESYARCYPHLLKLHVLSDLAWLAGSALDGRGAPGATAQAPVAARSPGQVAQQLLERAEATAATFLAREAVLSPLRVALSQLGLREDAKTLELTVGRLCRKHRVPAAMEHPSGTFTCVSPGLQVRAQFEWARLLYARGFRDDALQHLQQLAPGHPKARLLATRWATEAAAGLLIPRVAEAEFWEVKERLPESEAAWFHHACYLDQLLKDQTVNKPSPASGGVDARQAQKAANSSPFDLKKLVVFTLRGYLQALHRGNKRLHLILNRVLQLAWDCCELDVHPTEALDEIKVQSATMHPWMWYVVLPQLVSRVQNTRLRPLFTSLIAQVLVKYPSHAVWHIIQLLNSQHADRNKLGRQICQECSRHGKDVFKILGTYHNLAKDLVQLATSSPPDGQPQMSLQRFFPRLLGSTGSTTRPAVSWQILVPLQQQMTASIPKIRSPQEAQAPFEAFPDQVFAERCLDMVDVFRTKERPKKLTFVGNDGRQYPFLCKAERRGDLRKDSRMMMFGSMVNQLLEQNPDAARRNLRLVTFNVVILQENCGLIEWVSQTRGVRHIIDELWKRLRPGQQQSVREIKEIFDNSKDLHETFTKQVLPRHPPLLHKWFALGVDPSVWLSKRITFARSQALWCMLGYIVGLGDRHGENILIETDSGRLVHVDFDCLFGKGMLLERPETVPFRLTQNCVSAMGVTGIEGVFRQSCELSMEVLRDHGNKQTLLSVLHMYIADPLIEWITKPHKDARQDEDQGIQQARDTIGDVEKKLNGMLNVGAAAEQGVRREAESVLSAEERGRGLLGRDRGVGLSVAGQVDELLKAAMCKRNLSEMYVGWQPWV